MKQLMQKEAGLAASDSIFDAERDFIHTAGAIFAATRWRREDAFADDDASIFADFTG